MAADTKRDEGALQAKLAELRALEERLRVDVPPETIAEVLGFNQPIGAMLPNLVMDKFSREQGKAVAEWQSVQSEIERTEAALRNATSARGITSTFSATVGDVTFSGKVGSAPTINHPILQVEGRGARMSEIIEAKLADGGDAFSDSTRSALARACSAPLGESEEGGAPVIGLESFLRAALSQVAWDHGQDKTPALLSESIVKYLMNTDSGERTLRASLFGLVQGTTSPGSVDSAVANSELTSVLAEAARLVQRLTRRQARIDLRHALIAALKTPQAQRVFFDLGVTGSKPEDFFSGLFQAVEQHLRDAPAGQAGDKESELSTIIGELAYDPAAAPPVPLRQSELHYVADGPALSLAEDRLGVADEARALAEVICLREPGPPLAIGLFGDWGSGKSTYMNMMEAAISELTARVKGDEEGRKRFVTKVVSIRFNAWHYNDANLWASLTSEFFSQLRAGGHGARAGANYKELVNEVVKRVAKLEGEAASEAETAVVARKEADSARIELEGLLAKRGMITGRALAGTLQTMLSQVSKSQLTRMRDAMDGLGHPLDLPEDKKDDPDALRAALDARSQEIQTEIIRAAELSGRIGAFGRALARALVFGDLKTAALLYGGFLLATAAVIGFETLPLDGLQAAIGRLAASGATVVALVFGLRKVYRTVEPIFRAATDFATRLRTGREALERKITEKQEVLAVAQKKLADAEAARAQKEAEAARFRGGKPEQVLDYFLNVSDETKRFEGELGTVSRVRRAFEQLNSIVEQKRETSEVERIVLYIDDLDRCQVHQVVKVLEAVHLLLAFPLFVVVVGVDSRWLQNSLLKFYEKQLGASGDASQEVATATDRATVQDYLEKIFQIPVRLRPLRDITDGGLRRYLDSVAGPIDADGSSVGDSGTQAGSNSVAHTTDGTNGTRITPIEVRLKPVAETVQQTLQRIALRRGECDMIEALSPFLCKSPRAVKRFMNIYRLIRGLHRGSELDAFLDGVEGAKAMYPAVQFWLAVEIGMKPDLAACVGRIVRELASTLDGLENFLAVIRNPSGPITLEHLERVTDFHEELRRDIVKYTSLVDKIDSEAYFNCIMKVVEKLPGAPGVGMLQAAHAETLRFTFRSA